MVHRRDIDMLKHIIIATVLVSFGAASAAEARSVRGSAAYETYKNFKLAKIKRNTLQERASNQQNAVDRQKINQHASQDGRRTGLDSTKNVLDIVRAMKHRGY
jgi:hypothetical protein